eukprot:SAG31_NODE_2328_length_5934_cov_1.958355_2_plen_91_part_00
MAIDECSHSVFGILFEDLLRLEQVLGQRILLRLAILSRLDLFRDCPAAFVEAGRRARRPRSAALLAAARARRPLLRPITSSDRSQAVSVT